MNFTFFYGLSRIVVSLICMGVFGLAFKRKTRIPALKYFKYFALSMSAWELFVGLYYIVGDIQLLPTLTSLMYAVMPFSVVFAFYFSFAYAFPYKIHLMKYLQWLMIIPIITSFLALTAPYHTLFITTKYEIYYNPLRQLTDVYHIWFYVHSTYNYTLLTIGLIMLLYKIKQRNTQNRIECITILFAALLYILSNFYRTFLTSDAALWLTPILKTGCVLIIYLTLHYDETDLITSIGSEEALESIPFAVFFLDRKDIIIYGNANARTLCPGIWENRNVLHSKQDIINYFTVIDFSKDHIHPEKGLNTVLLQKEDTGEVYYLQENEILKKNLRTIRGKVLIFYTLQSMQDFFSSLKEKVFVDPLCSVYNRHYLEIQKLKLAVKESLPLSFLLCDIDGLKTVNDTFGHIIGDEYIVLCSKAIQSSVRETDLIFRIGGDEFLILLPKTTLEKSLSIAEIITEKVRNGHLGQHYTTSISIGCSTATSFPIDFENHMIIADKNMYIVKTRHHEMALAHTRTEHQKV